MTGDGKTGRALVKWTLLPEASDVSRGEKTQRGSAYISCLKTPTPDKGGLNNAFHTLKKSKAKRL